MNKKRTIKIYTKKGEMEADSDALLKHKDILRRIKMAKPLTSGTLAFRASKLLPFPIGFIINPPPPLMVDKKIRLFAFRVGIFFTVRIIGLLSLLGGR